jgi:uncharacterized repeat protein (TIGR02543 family)
MLVKSNSGWKPIKGVFVKTNSGWKTVKKAFVKTLSGWAAIWPSAGPVQSYEVDLSSSKSSYPSSGTSYPVLTGTNYHWDSNSTISLSYVFQSSAYYSGPWTTIKSGSYISNPQLNSSSTVTYTPALSDYVAGVTYFNFAVTATDGNGNYNISSSASQYDTIVTLPAPTFSTNPSWSGTPVPGYSIAWNTGTGVMAGSSIEVGYQTTIYKSNNGGATKIYLVGTSTTPDYQYSNNYSYSFNLSDSDVGYTYYASTYTVDGNGSGPLLNSLTSETISGTKSVAAIPGAFSITSAVRGVYANGSRSVTVNWTTSQNATSYEAHIESSGDGTTWVDQTTFGYTVAYPPTTSGVFTVYTNSAYLRITMRSTNISGLYAVTNTVSIVGQAPTAPTILSATSTTTDITLTFAPPSNNGSSNDIRYLVAYKTSASSTWGAYNLVSTTNNTLHFYDILASGTSYDFKMQAENFDFLYSPDSNIFTFSTQIAPGPITNVIAKSFDSGFITTFFKTGTNTQNMNIDYFWFQTQPPLGDDNNFSISASSSSTYAVTNSTILNYPSQPYNITLIASNNGGLSTNYGTAFYVYAGGGDKPTSSSPTFTNFNYNAFTANFNTFNATNATIDLKTNGYSVSGYPKNIGVSNGTNQYAIPETLNGGSAYTFYVTPIYKYPYDISLSYTGSQVASTVTYLGAPQPFNITTTSKAYPVIGTPGHRSVTVSWSQSVNATKYEVYLEHSNDGITWGDEQTYTVSPYTFEPTRTATINAVSYNYYRATVRASNTLQVGSYSYSNSNTPTQIAGTPPGDPTIGSVTVTSNSASIPYTTTSSSGSNLYSGVQYSTDSINWSSTTTVNPISLSNLSSGSTYTFYLRSVNSDGYTSTGASTSFTTNLNPSAFNTISGTKAYPTGAVQSPSEPSQSRTLSTYWYTSTNAVYYEVQYEGSNDNSTWTVLQSLAGAPYLSSNSNTYVAAYYRYYRYSVRARNAAKDLTTAAYSDGGSSGSLQYYYITGSNPSNITISSVTPGTGSSYASATVSYSFPSNPGSNTIDWNYWSLDNANWTQVYGTTFTIPNLSASTGYYVYMRSMNYDMLYSGSTYQYFATNAAPVYYTVLWGANGGTVSPTSSTQSTVGGSVTAPTPTLSGYSFNGWYNAASGGSLIVNGGGSYTPSSNVTLYAQWTYIHVYPTISSTLGVSSTTTTSAVISWAQTNASYDYLNGSTYLGLATSTTLTGLSPSTAYSGYVTVYSTTGDTATGYYSFTTASAGVKPSAPTGLYGSNDYSPHGGHFYYTASSGTAPITYYFTVTRSTTLNGTYSAYSSSSTAGTSILVSTTGYFKCSVYASNAYGSSSTVSTSTGVQFT